MLESNPKTTHLREAVFGLQSQDVAPVGCDILALKLMMRSAEKLEIWR
jgi:hypothetical protein